MRSHRIAANKAGTVACAARLEREVFRRSIPGRRAGDVSVEKERNMATIEEFQAGMTRFIDAVMQAVCITAEQVMPIIQQIYDMMYAKYLEAGAPYGESPEGLSRWMDEIAEIRQMEMRIEEIASHHAALALLRKRLAEKRVVDEI